jgi:hypothetical protein
VYVGASEVPEPGSYAMYELLAESSSAVLWLYRYAGTLTQ